MKIKRGREIAVILLIVFLVFTVYLVEERLIIGGAYQINDQSCNQNITQDSDLNINIDGGLFGCSVRGVNIIANNVIFDCKNYKILGVGGYGIYVNSSNVTIKNCEVYGFDEGIYLDQANDTVIINSKIYSNNNNNIYLIQSNRNTIDSNTIYSAANDHGIYLLSSSNNLIKNNTIYQNNVYGISLKSSTYNTVQENIIYDHKWTSLSTGIYLETASNYNNITGNLIENNTHGVGLDASTYNEVAGNTISKNQQSGILPYGGSDHNFFYNNLITANGFGSGSYLAGFYEYLSGNNHLNNNIITGNLNGVYLRGAANDLVINNNISNSAVYGIYIVDDNSASSNNMFYNNFLSNNFAGHALDSSSSGNSWNTPKAPGTNILGGPYFGGNYWSDYTGQDVNYDGLGDSPYVITTGIDNFPLVTYVPPPPGPNITINKTASTNQTYNGTYLNYTITIANNGDGNATNITVTDVFPSGVVYYTSNPTPTSGNNTWNFTTILNKTIVAINITVYIDENFTGNITNYVNITYQDENLGTNYSTDDQETTEVTMPVPTPLPDLINITSCNDDLETNAVLTQDISLGEDDEYCINFEADNLYLDCQGYKITGPGNFDFENFLDYAISIVGRNNITVKNCYIEDFTMGISVDESQDITITDNIFNNNGPAIWSYYVNNSVFNNNIIENCSSSVCDSWGEYGAGIFMIASNFNIIENNLVNDYNVGFVDVYDWETEAAISQNNQFINNSADTSLVEEEEEAYTDIILVYVNDTVKDCQFSSYYFEGAYLTFEKSNSGKIRFDDMVTSYDSNDEGTLNLSEIVQISQNRIFVNTTADYGFQDVPATLTLKNLNFINPKPQIDANDNGQFADCTYDEEEETGCTEISYSNGEYVFSVSGFTSYRATETITGQPSLLVTKTDSPDPVLNNSQLNYTVTISNTGTAPAGNVQVIDSLPSSVSLVSANPSPDAGDPNAPIWNIGSLNNGTSTTIVISTLVSQNVTNNSDLINTINLSYYNGTETVYLNAQAVTRAYVGQIPVTAPPSVVQQLSSSGGGGRRSSGGGSYFAPCKQEWQCSEWSSCTNNQQTRTCADVKNCAQYTTYETTPKPAETQSCSVSPTATCTDGIKNQGESDVDCSGPCPACAEDKICLSNVNCLSQTCLRGRCVSPGTECVFNEDCNIGYECVSSQCQAIIVERAPASFWPTILIILTVVIVGLATITGSVIGGAYVKHRIIARDLNQMLEEAGRLASAKNLPALKGKYLNILSKYKKLPEQEKFKFYNQINRLYSSIKETK